MAGAMEYVITKSWDGSEVTHTPVKLTMDCQDDGLHLLINAPFFNDPGNPGGAHGKPFDKLWDYEVVEAFFLDSAKQEYLEVEFCPHGQHQILALKGRRKPHKCSIELDSFKSQITDNTWRGVATIPWGYFPKTVNKFNAYAIHGSGDNREYQSLYPADGSCKEPDFHRLEYFKNLDFNWQPKHKMRSPAIWSD